MAKSKSVVNSKTSGDNKKENLGKRKKAPTPSPSPEPRRSTSRGVSGVETIKKAIQTNDAKSKATKNQETKTIEKAGKGSKKATEGKDSQTAVVIEDSNPPTPEKKKRGRQPSQQSESPKRVVSKETKPVKQGRKQKAAVSSSVEQTVSNRSNSNSPSPQQLTTSGATAGRAGNKKKAATIKQEYQGSLEALVRTTLIAHKNLASIDQIVESLEQAYTNISAFGVQAVFCDLEKRGSVYLQNQTQYSLIKDELPQKPAQVVASAPAANLIKSSEEVKQQNDAIIVEDIVAHKKESQAKDAPAADGSVVQETQIETESAVNSQKSVGKDSVSKRGRPPKTPDAGSVAASAQQSLATKSGEDIVNAKGSVSKRSSQKSVSQGQGSQDASVGGLHAGSDGVQDLTNTAPVAGTHASEAAINFID